MLMLHRIFQPGVYPQNMKLDSKTAAFYHSQPSQDLDGRGAIVPAPRVLGGGSSMNFMVICAHHFLQGVSSNRILDVYESFVLGL